MYQYPLQAGHAHLSELKLKWEALNHRYLLSVVHAYSVLILSKTLTKYINDKKVELNTLIILLDLPELKKVYNGKILNCLSSFYANNKNRAIICKEMPNTTSF